jgi:tetratricopeptide (TPR) repeat protein
VTEDGPLRKTSGGTLEERIEDATLQLTLGMGEEAVAALEALLAEHPSSATALAALAYARLLLGRYDGALEAALAVLARTGDGAEALHREAHFVAARALGRRAAPGDFDEALPHLAAALEDLGVLGSALEHREDLGALADTPAFAAAVLAATRRWAEREPASEDAWYAVAREELAQRHGDAAVNAARRLVSLAPRSGLAHYVLACTLAVRDGLGDREAALVHANDAVRLDPGLREAIANDPELATLEGKAGVTRPV